jgi:hypothetical protein
MGEIEITAETKAEAPTNSPKKPYSRNWKKLIAIYLAIAVILYGAIYYLILNKQESNPYSVTKSSQERSQSSPSAVPTNPPNSVPEKVINALYEKTQTLKGNDILIDKNPKFFPGNVWWISEDNYNILVPTSSFLRLQSKAINEDYGDNTYKSVLSKPGMQSFFDLAVTEMTSQGFQKNTKNSSFSLTDTKYVDYVQAYEKSKTKCTVSVDPGTSGLGGSTDSALYFSISVGCTDDFDTSYAEQVPFLKALNERESVLSRIMVKDNFATMALNFRRTGAAVFMYKSGGEWRKAAIGQSVPLCDELTKANVPQEFWVDCYEAGGNLRKGNPGWNFNRD